MSVRVSSIARWALNVLPHIFPDDIDPRTEPLKLVTIWLGTNDAVLPGEAQHVPVAEYEDNLRKTVCHIRIVYPKARIVLFTPPAVTPPFRSREITSQYARTAVTLADELGLPSLDCFDEMEKRAREIAGGDLDEGLKTFLTDGVHLTPEGYEVSATMARADSSQLVAESLVLYT